MNRLLAVSLLAAAVFATLVVVTPASAHRSWCHSSHSCPSDHHTYAWNGLYCTSYADERLATDTRTVFSDERRYWCGSKQTGPLMNAVPRTITVATSSAVAPASPITVSSTFSPVPRSITVVTSGAVDDVTVATSACYGPKHGYAPISRARDDRAGRIAVGYDHTATRCTITATASADSAKPGSTFKIALQIER
jgi:hypothetical protein